MLLLPHKIALHLYLKPPDQPRNKYSHLRPRQRLTDTIRRADAKRLTRRKAIIDVLFWTLASGDGEPAFGNKGPGLCEVVGGVEDDVWTD
jgi:hypothetical protein